MKTEEQPIIGQNEKYTEEEISSFQEDQAKAKIRIMDDLDKIRVPIMCTVILDPAPFEYRNAEFWKALKDKDNVVREILSQWLTNSKRK